MSHPTTNPLGLFWLLLAMLSCGLLTFLIVPGSESDPLFEEFSVDSEAPTTMSEPTSIPAANADVTFVRVIQTGPGTWTFHVTVAHPDTGWDDYADGWDVVLPDGTVVKPDPAAPFTRLLLHPHETEQPFTRSQRGIVIPANVTTVTVRAHDLVDGWGGREVTVDLTIPAGPDFEVTTQ